MQLAERRFRPEFAAAFDAWFAADPANDPAAPSDPTSMDQYRQPAKERSAALASEAEARFRDGVETGDTAD